MCNDWRNERRRYHDWYMEWCRRNNYNWDNDYYRECYNKWYSCYSKNYEMVEYSSSFNKCGNILISDQFNNRVIEVDNKCQIVWSFGKGPLDFTPNSPIGVNDAQRVGELTLIAATGTPPGLIDEAPNGFVDSRVLLVNQQGVVVWQYGQFGITGSGFNLLNTPVQATFIGSKKCCKCNHTNDLCGTVLISDQGNNRIIEVNKDKQIIWQFPDVSSNIVLNSPNSAEKLMNHNVLIADENNNRAIEVDMIGNIVAVYTASGTLGACAFASRLENGNTLLTDAGNNRAVEVDISDNIVWQYSTNTEFNSVSSSVPTRALRLKNGNTVISDQLNNRVIVVNKTAVIMDYFGLPLSGGSGVIGDNSGYNLLTSQLGLYAPYDAKFIDDYTGITKPWR